MKNLASLYAVFDTKSMQYSAPLIMLDDTQALYWFDKITDQDSFRTDYILYKLGSYNFDNASFEILSVPEYIVQFSKPIEEDEPEEVSENFDDYEEYDEEFDEEEF